MVDLSYPAVYERNTVNRDPDGNWYRSPLPRNLLAIPGTLRDDFESAAVWTVNNGAAANDAVHFKVGTQSVKITSAVGGFGRITRAVSWYLEDSNEYRIWFYLEDVTKLDTSTVKLILYDTTGAKTFTFTVTAASILTGWNLVAIRRSDWIAAGGMVWENTIASFRLEFSAVGGQQAVISWDGFYSDVIGLPGVIITFEDADDTVYTMAYPLMETLNIPGTFYVRTGQVGGGGNVTSANLLAMQTAGWCIANHTQTHPDLTGLGLAAAEAEIQAGINDLLGWGITGNSPYHLSYPGGTYNATVLQAAINRGCLTGRTNDTAYYSQLPYDQPLLVSRNYLVTNATTFADIATFIDSLITTKQIGVIVIPVLVEGAPGAGEWEIENFEALLAYIKYNRLNCLTMDQVYTLQSGPLLVQHSIPFIPNPRSFYVDFTGGNDANTGRSPTHAWKTITKINNYASYQLEDRILFKKGETWVGICLVVPANHLYFGSYGIGANPIIDGNDLVECIQVASRSYLMFEGIDATQGFNSGFQFNTCDHISVINCKAHDCGNDNLIFISNCHNCEVIGGVFYNPYERVPGTLISCIEIADNGSDILIDGVECYGSVSVGITVHNHSTADPQGRTDIPTRIVIRNGYFHNNAGNGINIMAQDVSVRPEIVIYNCISNLNDTGVRIAKTVPSIYYPQGVLIDQCKFKNNITYGFYIQGDDCKLQRCEITGLTQQNRVLDSKRLKFYNNTIYLNPAGALFPLYVMGGARVNGVIFKNNIIFMANVAGQEIGFAASSTTNCILDYNYYYFFNYGVQARWQWEGAAYTYANWKITSGQDVHSNANPATDVLFTNIPGDDFTLQAGSPAINAGIYVDLPYIGVAPDCGAYEKQ